MTMFGPGTKVLVDGVRVPARVHGGAVAVELPAGAHELSVRPH